MKLLQIITLLLILSASFFAQTKIATIDTKLFEDEKLGIIELVIAKKKIAEEFKALDKEFNKESEKLTESVKKLKSEISFLERADLPKDYDVRKKVEEKVAEHEKLVNAVKSKIEKARLQLEKRESEIVEPVKKRIAEKLDIFKQKKGYFSIFDRSKIDDGFIDEKLDITTDFIKFCNEEFEKEKLQK